MARSKTLSPKKAYILQILTGVCVMVVVAGLGYGIWYVTRLPSLTIHEVVVSGGDTVKPGVVKTAIETELEGAYAALIPRTFSYLYPAAAITSSVEAIPRVKDVELARTDRNTLTVSFTEYRPEALWCDQQRRHCLFVDEAGYAFADAPVLVGGSLLRFVVEDAPPVLHGSLLSPTQIEYATLFAELIQQEFEFTTSEYYFEQNGDMTLTLSGGAHLLLSQSIPAGDSLANLETILGSDEFAHLRSDNFQYIDLRFGNKVYVNEEIAVPDTPNGTSTASSSSENW